MADPRFSSWGGGINSLGQEGAPTYDVALFPLKLHEIERVLTPGEDVVRPKFYYVDPPLKNSHILIECPAVNG